MTRTPARAARGVSGRPAALQVRAAAGHPEAAGAPEDVRGHRAGGAEARHAPVGPGAARSQSVDAGRPATAGERRDSEGSAQREGDADPSQEPQQGDVEDSSDSDDSDEDASDSEGDNDDLQSERLEAAAGDDAGTSSDIPQAGQRPRDQRADSVEEVAAGADGTDLPTDSLEVLPGQELEQRTLREPRGSEHLRKTI